MVAKTQHLMPTQTSSNEALQEPLQEPRESNSTHCQTLSPKRVLKEVPKEKNLQRSIKELQKINILILNFLYLQKTKIQPAGHGQEDGTVAEHVERVVVGRVIEEPVVDITEMSILTTIKAGSTISV
ncbi:hypothetical protein RF55_20940, partial [Lasius niger]